MSRWECAFAICHLFCFLPPCHLDFVSSTQISQTESDVAKFYSWEVVADCTAFFPQQLAVMFPKHERGHQSTREHSAWGTHLLSH